MVSAAEPRDALDDWTVNGTPDTASATIARAREMAWSDRLTMYSLPRDVQAGIDYMQMIAERILKPAARHRVISPLPVSGVPSPPVHLAHEVLSRRRRSALAAALDVHAWRPAYPAAASRGSDRGTRHIRARMTPKVGRSVSRAPRRGDLGRRAPSRLVLSASGRDPSWAPTSRCA